MHRGGGMDKVSCYCRHSHGSEKADAPRVVPMGRQAVAAQPVEEDFAKAAVYTINYDTSGINNYDNLFSV